MFTRSRVAAVALVAVISGPVVSEAPVGIASASESAPVAPEVGSDFNGDGYADLAVGVPEEDIAGLHSVGAVSVIYGSDAGLRAAGNQLWTQDTPGIPEQIEDEDLFGRGLAVGDFDGDGYDDLAIGAAFDDVEGTDRAGVLHVLFGSGAGLGVEGTQVWTQGSAGLADQAEEGDLFGDVVASGDLDADGFDELVVGVPGEDVGSEDNAGIVQVLYGSAAGPTADRDELWSQDSEGIGNTAEAWDEFGIALAIARFDGDGYDDLAVGVPFERLAGGAGGAAAVLYGSATGLTAVGSQLWSQDSVGVRGDAESEDLFALVLSSGDLDGDGYDDLVAGVPHEGISGPPGAGAVNVLYGSASGITAADDQLWSQESAGIADRANCVLSEDNWCDLFGWSVGAGDFDADGFDELVVGVPGEDLASADPRDVDQGLVQVIRGSAAGLIPAGDERWTQDSTGVKDVPELDDRFGWTLVTDRFGPGAREDLAISVAWEDVGRAGAAGVINVLYGSASGLTAAGNQRWSQDHAGILGSAERGDLFGLRLSEGGYPA